MKTSLNVFYSVMDWSKFHELIRFSLPVYWQNIPSGDDFEYAKPEAPSEPTSMDISLDWMFQVDAIRFLKAIR